MALIHFDFVSKCLRWTAQKLGDKAYLFIGRVTSEQRLPQDHFRKDAADSPEIYGLCVPFLRKQDFRSSVPSGGYVICQCQLLTILQLRKLRPGQTKITDFEVAIRINQEVARLQVPMEDPS